MDQTKFEALQPTLRVVSELYMTKFLRIIHGNEFTLVLMVDMPDGATAPLEIYVTRVPVGQRNVVFTAADGTKVVATKARIEPEGEQFDIDIILEKSADSSIQRPLVRTSAEMIRLLKDHQRERLERLQIESFLRAIEQDGTAS